MDTEFSKPLVALPSFLSTISMVVDDRAAIIQQLIQAERKSPPKYGPTRDLFIHVLEGNFTFEEALQQASRVDDPTERRCAIEILSASERFLRVKRAARTGRFPAMQYFIPNGMPLDVSPLWIRHLDPERLMVLHFWETPLSPRQLSAAAAVSKLSLLREFPQYSSCELDFISVPLSTSGDRRQFQGYNWTKLKPLSEEALARFWRQFLLAWSDYQRRPPREFRRKREPSLFDYARRTC